VSDCYLLPNEQCISHVIARTMLFSLWYD